MKLLNMALLNMALLKQFFSFTAVATFVIAAGCNVHTTAQGKEMLTTEKLFEKELQQQGIKFKKIETHLYEVQLKDGAKTVSLQNIDKIFSRDGDADAIKLFTANIVQPVAVLPAWDKVKTGIFVAIQAGDTEGLDTALHKKLSVRVAGVLAYYNTRTNQVRWLTTSDLKNFAVPENTAWNTAQENLEKIARSTKVSFSNVAGQKLGIIEAEEPYKASLILTQALKSKVEKELGWPVYAVAPARDFVYLFSKSGDMVERVGTTVVKEYQQSGYPLSTEIWELSDHRQKAIGAFPVK